MTSSSLYSAFWHFPFKLHSCTCHFTSWVYQSCSHCFVIWWQFNHREGRAVALPSKAWHPAALISLSWRQLWNQWKTKGSHLKVVSIWFLLIDLPAPLEEKKYTECQIFVGPHFTPGVLLIRSQGDKCGKRGAPFSGNECICKSCSY